jgi:hypothetical protein
MTGKELDAPAASGEVIAYNPAIWPDLAEQDPAKVAERFERRFMAAGTMDALFAALGGSTSKNMAGRRVEIRAVEWTGYLSEAGIIPMAICDAADAGTGEVLEFVTTSMALTLFIRRAELIGGLPFTARITETKTRSGQTALNFEPA